LRETYAKEGCYFIAFTIQGLMKECARAKELAPQSS
jgi:hypothetical protein